jgi:hypothetical protein
MARIARSRRPFNVCSSGAPKALAPIYSQPISQTHAEFLCSFDSLDTGGRFRAEQSTVSGLEGQAPHRRQAKVDRGCGKGLDSHSIRYRKTTRLLKANRGSEQ